MKAVRIHQYGSSSKLSYEEVARPEISSNEVLVKVHAAGVNPVDWKIREGYLQELISYDLPLTLGWDVSGVVEAVGSEVANLNVGDQVYSRPDINRNGTYAEYVAINGNEVAIKPQSIDHIEAAGIPLAGLTAWQALFGIAQLKAGQRVLIHAAAGGVGSIAVQLAKIIGAHVIGTASKKNKEYLLSLGVDIFIDYQKQDFAKELSNVDVVFDTIGGEIQDKSWDVIKDGGVLVSVISQPSELKAKQRNVKATFHMTEPNAEHLTQLAHWIDNGDLRIHIEKVLSLEEAAKAHELSQTGKVRGKIILQVV